MNYLNKYVVNRCSVVTTTLLLLIYVSATLDTHLFVYPSLSRTLIPELLILLLITTALLYGIVKKRNFINSKETWFVLTWIAYIIIHYASVYPHEQYRTMYLVVSLLLIPTVSFVIHHNLISRSQCENIVLFVAIIQIIFVFAQWTGLITSENIYFTLTGSNENPTVTSLYLVGCVPIISARLYRGGYRILYFSVLLLCLVSIGALRCRTAYIGLSVELLVATAIYLKKRNISTPKSFRFPFLFVLILMVTSIGFKLYDMKRDSADGRILIWKLSSKMIIGKPQGYGYGLFEKYYNLCQSDYFAQGNGIDKEKALADFVFMPYNDFLEHGVEGGVVGMTFLVAFYVLMIYNAKRKHDIVCLSVFVAFATMSLTNFIYSSIQPWLLLMLYSSFVASENIYKEKLIFKRTNIFILTICIVLSCMPALVKMLRGQMKLYEYKEHIMEGEYVSNDDFTIIQNSVGTSEAYWTLRAYNDFLQQKYSEATIDIQEAQKYTSSPQSMEMIYKTYLLSDNKAQGVRYLEKLRNMIPSLLRPKLMLMQYYDNQSNIEKAVCLAKEIVDCHVKIDNEKSRRIHSIADNYLKSHK